MNFFIKICWAFLTAFCTLRIPISWHRIFRTLMQIHWRKFGWYSSPVNHFGFPEQLILTLLLPMFLTNDYYRRGWGPQSYFWQNQTFFSNSWNHCWPKNSSFKVLSKFLLSSFKVLSKLLQSSKFCQSFFKFYFKAFQSFFNVIS